MQLLRGLSENIVVQQMKIQNSIEERDNLIRDIDNLHQTIIEKDRENSAEISYLKNDHLEEISSLKIELENLKEELSNVQPLINTTEQECNDLRNSNAENNLKINKNVGGN